MSAALEPVMIMVAPNGARHERGDHPALPIAPAEVARAAAACRDAGASALHLHVRDRDGRHTLDAEAYRTASAAVREAVGDEMVVQVTSEAAGLYEPAAQMAMVREVRPEAVSLALREIVADEGAEPEAARFLEWLRRERIVPQYILYAPEDLERYGDLCRRGVIPGARNLLLFVLGRYAGGRGAEAADLLPFLGRLRGDGGDGGDGGVGPWAVCAFGEREGACVTAAAAFGGHMRVGFENNFRLAGGAIAPDNAALVAQASAGARAVGRPVADAAETRAMLRELVE